MRNKYLRNTSNGFQKGAFSFFLGFYQQEKRTGSYKEQKTSKDF
jgi:hypothetical protein